MTTSSKSTANRPQRGPVDKATQILTAATRVFVRDGFARASMDTIAAEAGVAKQTIYNHFGDKDNLVVTTVQGVLDPLTTDFQRIVDETIAAHDCADLTEQFVDFGKRWVDLMLRDDTVALRWQVVAEAVFHEQLRAILLRVDQDVAVRAVSTHLTALNESGRLRVPDAQDAARQLRSLLIGEAQLASMFGYASLDGDQVEQIVRSGVGLFMRAYAPDGR